MKLQFSILASFLLWAGSAAAGEYGFGASHPAPVGGFGAYAHAHPGHTSPPAYTPPTPPRAPKAPDFGSSSAAPRSVYGPPKVYGQHEGAKPCETSVYVDACRGRR